MRTAQAHGPSSGSRRFLLLVPGALALLLSACGGGGGDGEDSAPPTDPPPAATFTVGGAMSGLAGGTAVLQLNGSSDLSLTADGAFTFPLQLADGSAYDVRVTSQPAGRTCTVSNGSGVVPGADVTAVAVQCAAATAPTFSRRVESTELDYDADGLTDATETFTYDAEGKAVQRRYVYTGDSTPDRIALFGNRNVTMVMDYAGDHRAARQTTTYDDGTGERTDWRYDGAGRVTRLDSSELDAGGVTLLAYTLYSYTGELMTQSVMFDAADNELMRQQIVYDAAGLPAVMTRTGAFLDQRTIYGWNADATLASEVQDVNNDGIADQTTTYAYAGGRLVSTVRVFSGLYASQPGLTYLFTYDADGVLQRVDSDRGSDGSIEAVQRLRYQSAACRSIVLPVVFPQVTENGYGSSAGPEWTGYCAP